METEEGEERKPIMVRVVRHVREGEYGKTGRFEFPASDIIFDILAASYPNEKHYNFYHFDNILVSNNYSLDVDRFLADEAKKLGYILKIENRKLAE